MAAWIAWSYLKLATVGAVFQAWRFDDPKEAPNARVYGGRLVRFYVGLEDPVDLIADIEQAFRI